MTLCPVCGYELDFEPWPEGKPIDKPCPCCGIHFGHDDIQESLRESVYHTWRERWVRQGKYWWSNKPRPADLDRDEQLRQLLANRKNKSP